MGFASGQFTGSESSGFIEVVATVTGGSSSTPITATVTPTEQSPVSAMGMYVCCIYKLLGSRHVKEKTVTRISFYISVHLHCHFSTSVKAPHSVKR